MNDVLDRPELAVAALLAIALLWVSLAFWLRLRAVGDEGLDRPWLTEVPAVDRYAWEVERRDYSHDRGPVAQPKPRPAGWLPPVVMPDIFTQLLRERGWRS